MGIQSENAELTRLLDALCDERITADEHSRLQELLRDDPAAQTLYLAYVDLHLGLKQVASLESRALKSIERRPGQFPAPRAANGRRRNS